MIFKNKLYSYSFVYSFQGGVGNINYVNVDKIKSIDDHNYWKGRIQEDTKLENVFIINYFEYKQDKRIETT